MKHKFYVSLCRGLTGYYVVFLAPDAETVRLHAAAYFGRVWCSVYDEEYFNQRIKGRYPNEHTINEDRPIKLDSWEWE